MVKNYAKMEEVSLSSIKPKGWLEKFLRMQADGLTGHLEVAGYPFDQVGWDRFEIDTTKQNDNPGWWAYEQTAYWVDGMERTAELLGDRKLRKKAGASFDFVLDNKDPDGYLGPKFMKQSDGWNRWPHAVFFRAIMAKYSATGDEKYVEALANHYLGHEQDYSNARDVMNVEGMIFAYLHTGDKRLLDLAEDNYKRYNEKCRDDNCVAAHLSGKKAYAHGVTYNEFAKLGAILYMATGKKEYLRPTLKAYKKIDRYQMLVDGLHCSNEFLLDNDYMQTHETCDIVDYTWAIGQVLMATGDGEWADKIERCIFNAGIGSVDEQFKALQYFSCPNQLVLDRTSNHSDFFRADKWMSFRPNPGTECCAGNVNRFFPVYCSRMWMKKRRDIFAVLYGASEVSYGKRDAKVTIKEETAYPFEDEIRFVFDLKGSRKLRFHVRIPGWCEKPTVKVNGKKIEVTPKNGFALIEREFTAGDVVTLELPSEVKVCDYHGQGNYVEKGPLVYAYGMMGDRRIDEKERRSTKKFPAYNIYPDKDWNYAICTDEKSLREVKFERRGEVTDTPWSLDSVPMCITIPAKKVKGWELTHRKKVNAVHNLYTRPWKLDVQKGDFTFTPRFPSAAAMEKNGLGETEEITLVPMAAVKVRLTIFPKI